MKRNEVRQREWGGEDGKVSSSIEEGEGARGREG